MIWKKKGLIYCPTGKSGWDKNYAIYPTPRFIRGSNILRVYFGVLDVNNFGRTEFIDLDPSDPSVIIDLSNKVSLDLGSLGQFDDSGAIPSCYVEIHGKKYLYYNGFCRSVRTPYHIFSGLAEIDSDESINRTSTCPVLDRTSEEYIDRAGQVVLNDNGILKCWYVSASKWEDMDSVLFKRQMPVYRIKYATSKNGYDWIVNDKYCIDFENEDEFGFGRPWVIKSGDMYRMWYSIRRRSVPYRIGYAESLDGIEWERKDREVGIDVSEAGWDSEMVCFPSVIKVKDKTFMFYNGNNNGKTGFGVAELIEW
ncbi:hypothetical protein [Ekhidna sp.]|uniref:hypothetical protein n=1 Tax=Ekhidna sp. TaxID=2608089 RepID=UPI0032978CBA